MAEDRGPLTLHTAKHRRRDNDPRVTVEPRAYHAAVLDADRRFPALVQAFLAGAPADAAESVELGHQDVRHTRNVDGRGAISWTDREAVAIDGHVVWDEQPVAEPDGRVIGLRAVLVGVDGVVYARVATPDIPARPSTLSHHDFLPGLRVDHVSDGLQWVWRVAPALPGSIAFHTTDDSGPSLGVRSVDSTERWLLDRMADYLAAHNPAVLRRRRGARPRPGT